MCILSLQREQSDTIRKFRNGNLNLLISTSVAEEGLDIPECNLVVRYGLLTNEIAQQQASGRARARDSQYSVVAQKGGREVRRELTNEYLEELTGKAIAKVQDMSPQEFRIKVRVWYSVLHPILSMFSVSVISFYSSLSPDNGATNAGSYHQKSCREPQNREEGSQQCCQCPALVSKLFQARGLWQ